MTEPTKEFVLKHMKELYSDWEGWQCNVDGCYEVVGQDSGEMFDHLITTHSKEEMLEALGE